jgi:hypothetical protein
MTTVGVLTWLWLFYRVKCEGEVKERREKKGGMMERQDGFCGRNLRAEFADGFCGRNVFGIFCESKPETFSSN